MDVPFLIHFLRIFMRTFFLSPWTSRVYIAFIGPGKGTKNDGNVDSSNIDKSVAY